MTWLNDLWQKGTKKTFKNKLEKQTVWRDEIC